MNARSIASRSNPITAQCVKASFASRSRLAVGSEQPPRCHTLNDQPVTVLVEFAHYPNDLELRCFSAYARASTLVASRYIHSPDDPDHRGRAGGLDAHAVGRRQDAAAGIARPRA